MQPGAPTPPRDNTGSKDPLPNRVNNLNARFVTNDEGGELLDAASAPSETQSTAWQTSGPPHSIRIDPTFTGGHTFDDDPDVDGIYLVIGANDTQGRTVDLTQYDIDAELIVEAFPTIADDPAALTKPLGRWVFDEEKIAAFCKDTPIPGMHLPLQWSKSQRQRTQDLKKIRIEARLENGDQTFRCQQVIELNNTPAVARWTPGQTNWTAPL